MLRLRTLQRAAALMHFDPALAAALHDSSRPLPGWLHADEAALLRRTDPRAFRTDPERPLRLLSALLEEYPVSGALVGLDALRTFTTSMVFHSAVMRGRLIADAFGDWLLPRAGAVSQVELAVALARRRRPRRGAGLARAVGVEVVRVPSGTLQFYIEARAQLGSVPHDAVARGARLTAPPEPDTLEHLIVEDVEHVRDDAGSGSGGTRATPGPSVAPCAAALFALLSFAREGLARDALVDEARRLGANDDADELIASLVAEGLLAPIA